MLCLAPIPVLVMLCLAPIPTLVTLCLAPIPVLVLLCLAPITSSCDAVSGSHSSPYQFLWCCVWLPYQFLWCWGWFVLSASYFLWCWRWFVFRLALSCDAKNGLCRVSLQVLVMLKMVCVLSGSKCFWCAEHWKRRLIGRMEVTIKVNGKDDGGSKWCWRWRWRWIQPTLKVIRSDDGFEWKWRWM